MRNAKAPSTGYKDEAISEIAGVCIHPSLAGTAEQAHRGSDIAEVDEDIPSQEAFPSLPSEEASQPHPKPANKKLRTGSPTGAAPATPAMKENAHARESGLCKGLAMPKFFI